MSFIEPIVSDYVASAAIAAGARVALAADGLIVIAGASNNWIGVATQSIAAKARGQVRLLGESEVELFFLADGTIDDGDRLYCSASGKVSADPSDGEFTGYQALDDFTDGEIVRANVYRELPTVVSGATGPAGADAVVKSTSTTSWALAVGSKAFTTATAMTVGVGAYVLIARTSAPTTTWGYGQVTAISGTTITINVTSIVGSGTQTDWTLTVAGTSVGSAPDFALLTDAATVTWTLDPSVFEQTAKVTLGGSRTLAFSGAIAGMRGVLKVVQGGSGSYALTLPGGSKVIGTGAGAVTLSTAVGSIDFLSWIYDGTNFFWNYGLDYT
jgi:hypothetical protein